MGFENHCKEHGVNNCVQCAHRRFAAECFANRKIAEKLKEEPMKTKKIEIEVLPAEWSLAADGLSFELTFDQRKSINGIPRDSKFRVIAEYSIPEPSVSITPSDIDKICKEYSCMPEVDVNRFLKTRLFPGWE